MNPSKAPEGGGRPIYEFRPLPNFFKSAQFHRYADGAWIPDDGEYDLAFASVQFVSFCLYVEHPYPKNLRWSWLTTHWSGSIPGHPRGGNPWHYALCEGATEFGKDWGRDRHPNSLAGRSGMNWACAQAGCANGRHVEFSPFDPHIRAGLVRDRETKAVLMPPDDIRCVYCGGLALSKSRASGAEVEHG